MHRSGHEVCHILARQYDMDAAALFHERQADVAAFTALVFRRPTSAERKPRPTSASVSSATHTATSEAEAVTSSPPMIRVAAVTPAYRRPASANVPVSRVLQEIKARAEREQRMARKTKKMAKSDADDLAGDLPHLATSGSRSGAPLGAMGFSAQEIRDRTYLWMTELGSHCSSADDVSRRAAKKSAALTPQQQAQLRRLRIKRTRQRLLSHAQWALWLRRRRRLWHRRRPVARRRHLARQLALEYGRPIGLCRCCRSRRHPPKASTPARKARPPLIKAARKVVTQWLPSHSRLVKRFHYRIVFLAVQPGVTHVSLTTATSSIPSHHGGDAALSSTAPCETRRARRLRLCASCVTRVAIPCEPARKDHRFLQRWATALAVHHRWRLFCSPTAGNAHPSHSHASLTASAPAATMLADLSHHCVYVLTPRKKWPLSGGVCTSPNLPHEAASAVSSALTSLLAVLGLHPDVEGVGAAPSGVVFALSPTARHQRTRRTCATVVHGHMWCAGAACLENAALKAADQRRDSVSTLSRHTRVVPVVLVASLRARAAVASMEVLLFSEGPVHFTSRAMTQLRIQLVSSWNPCTLSSARASAFEYWRCDPCAPSSQSEPEALSTLQGALQRCARVYRRLQLRSFRPRCNPRARRGKSSASQPRKNAPRIGATVAGPRTAAHGPQRASSRLSLVAFPSFSSPFLSDSHRNGSGEGRAAPYAWRLALLYRVPESRRRAACTRIRDAAARSAASLGVERAVATPSPRRRCLLSWQARRAHFQLARRFFGFLLMAPPRTETTLSGAAARGRCRALGFQDRVTLLHLLGRPAYPLDYGLSRPSAAAQQRRQQRSRPTPKKGRVVRHGTKRSRTPTDGTSAAAAPVCARLPSYLHILKYYGNVSNAACRVFVRAAHTDHKLPTLHCSVGTVLLQYRWLQRRGRGALCIPGVARIGVVTSSAFFAQRFGCMVAPVWCCFPPTTSGTGGGPILAALDNEEEHALPVAAHGVHWTAASLVGDTASASDALTYLLAPPEVADDLLRRSALLQRDELPRKRAHSRHQRVFDLGQGRAMRELETLLYDPLSCSPVQLIQWYA
ncbi:conserved hypothetical protein [Leishmania infantum JPCM5]|uniref:Uncharacterized protein n=2 Tax=Leishmania infantum TaxID=5671 RepID=A4I8R2_LEIIN|nr:conserved hypothetical protein [Leishmania infantum JPCM5]CAC9530154.1 hypothetical_protein_-_conserved [Leishmania infantum]CAM71211.1 conserved hypothetical protein [Leishmania infantum JPCM5]SUZ45047.1 hypothetical_protein_-_conserved [Leishmania infantum]|eukprot:XP_001468131.1 conserved hypothetical protein [Leishmania infantum JPCM5]